MTEKLRRPRQLTTLFRLESPEPSAPILALHGHLSDPDPQGRCNYVGIATLSDGRTMMPFRGMVADSLVVVRKIPKPRGRTINEPGRIAKLLHEHMAAILHETQGGALTKWRAAAMLAMKLGNEDAPRNQAKDLADAAKGAKEIPAVQRAPFLLTWSGDEAGHGRAALLFLAGVDVQEPLPGHVRVTGRAWVCNWGNRSAHRAEIDATFRATDRTTAEGQRSFIEEFRAHSICGARRRGE